SEKWLLGRILAGNVEPFGGPVLTIVCEGLGNDIPTVKPTFVTPRYPPDVLFHPCEKFGLGEQRFVFPFENPIRGLLMPYQGMTYNGYTQIFPQVHKLISSHEIIPTWLVMDRLPLQKIFWGDTAKMCG